MPYFICLFACLFIHLLIWDWRCVCVGGYLTMLSTLVLQFLGSRDPLAQAFLVMELQAEATTEGVKGLQM